jgi:hypothetical protein
MVKDAGKKFKNGTDGLWKKNTEKKQYLAELSVNVWRIMDG